MDLQGPAPSRIHDATGKQVVLPDIALTDEQQEQLQALVNPLGQSEEYGLDLYREAKFALSRI